MVVTTIDALGHFFKQDNYSTVGGDGGCRVGEVRALYLHVTHIHGNGNTDILRFMMRCLIDAKET